MRDALTLLLQGEGFDVCSYPSAEAFLAELDRLQPICLLADLRLPDMDGLTLYGIWSSLASTRRPLSSPLMAMLLRRRLPSRKGSSALSKNPLIQHCY